MMAPHHQKDTIMNVFFEDMKRRFEDAADQPDPARALIPALHDLCDYLGDNLHPDRIDELEQRVGPGVHADALKGNRTDLHQHVSAEHKAKAEGKVEPAPILNPTASQQSAAQVQVSRKEQDERMATAAAVERARTVPPVVKPASADDAVEAKRKAHEHSQAAPYAGAPVLPPHQEAKDHRQEPHKQTPHK